MHLYFDDAVALTGFAASALDVKAEATRIIAACARLGSPRKQFTDRCEKSCVGGGVTARRATDRALVDADDLVEMIQSEQVFVGRRF